MINFLEISSDVIAIVVTFSVFFISGLSLFYYPTRNYKKKKKRCSVIIEAEVIGHDVKYHQQKPLFASMYRFYFNNQNMK